MLTKTKTKRITLDLPLELHAKIKTLASQNGETLKQLFIDLAQTKIVKQNLQAHLQTSQKNRKIPKPIPLGSDNFDLKQLIDEVTCPKF